LIVDRRGAFFCQTQKGGKRKAQNQTQNATQQRRRDRDREKRQRRETEKRMAFAIGRGARKKVALRTSKSSKETFFAPEADPFQNLLSLYTNPPTGEMTLEEFENAAVDRMTVLKEIDAASRQQGGLSNPTHLERVKEALAQYLPLLDHGKSRHETIRKDVISHFALRLAFSHGGDKEWWIKLEQTLLSIRLQLFYSSDLADILLSSGLSFPQLSLV